MSELSREQVEDRIDEICDECIAQDAPGYVQELKDTDADLRAKLEEQTKRTADAQRTLVVARAALNRQIADLTAKLGVTEAELDNYRSIAEREGASIAVSQLAASEQRLSNELDKRHAVMQQLTEAQATIVRMEIDRLRREHDCDEHCQDWTSARMDANKFRDERDQLQAIVTAQ